MIPRSVFLWTLTLLLPASVIAQDAPRAVAVRRAEPAGNPGAVTYPNSEGNASALRVGDTLEMRLSGMPSEFASEFPPGYTIGSDGTINVSYIGEIRAVGLTPSQLEKTIQQRFIQEKIFTRPTVIINVQQTARFISVGGGVRSPQRMPWSQDLTLYSAVSVAGGISDFGDEKKVSLIRSGRVVGVFDLRKIKKDPSIDPKVQPGDQIDVKQ